MSDDIEQTIKRNTDLIEQGKNLLGQAKAVLDEHARMYEKLGITREGVQRYLESEHVPPEDKKKIQQQVAVFEQEIARDIQRVEEEQRAQQQPHRAKKPRQRDMI